MTSAPPRDCHSQGRRAGGASVCVDDAGDGHLDVQCDGVEWESIGGGVEIEPARMTATGAARAISAAHAARFQQTLIGDEVVQVVLKPSLWYIGVLSWRWVLGVLLLHACVMVSGQGAWTATHTILFQGGVLVAVGRMAFAVMQWSSRWYFLTNRRVMRRSGVLRPEERHCLLTRVSAVNLRVNAWQRMLRIGSVQITPAEEKAAVVGWNFVQNPGRVHEMVEAAVRKAQSGGES